MAKSGKVNCVKCTMCGPKIKAKMDGKTVEYGKADKHGMTKVTFKDKDGPVTRTCPDHTIKPYDVPVVDATKEGRAREERERAEEEAERNKPPMPRIVDFGYGRACENCHATKGECHGSKCPARAHIGDVPVT